MPCGELCTVSWTEAPTNPRVSAMASPSAADATVVVAIDRPKVGSRDELQERWKVDTRFLLEGGMRYEILGAVKVKACRRVAQCAALVVVPSRQDGLFIGDALAAQEHHPCPAVNSWALAGAGPLSPWLHVDTWAEVAMSYVGTNLYVAGLPPGFNDAHLFQLFDRYGRIWSSRVCPSRRLGGFGYAFVKYGDPSHAAAAVRNLNGYDVGGACITVKFADNDRPQEEGKDSVLTPLPREVFVSGLRANTDEEFSEFLHDV
eukprot:Skav211824  [mRNA]  locus=scaffold305:608709:613182:- [translate_table: standard]